ncbi:Seryl-tRNA synthetase [Artemisia annua]|uniref:serine--tRNA ligase n=1 Tax=Artemisia annua TaxID=35608 RepID=A0A2U1NCR3_ARTAN|nr:Seryl-tRNA synthetase [Artemisia annua]
MLDINLFREDKGYDPEIIRESQRRRFEPVEIVDQVIHLDNEWRQRNYELEQLKKEFNKLNKQLGKLRNSEGDAHAILIQAAQKEKKDSIATKEAEVQDTKKALDTELRKIGNLVDDRVPIGEDEANNVVIRTWGEKRTEPNLKNHVKLMEDLGIADTIKGSNVAGNRGYFLKGAGAGVRLNQALINFGLDFLENKGYTPLQTPFFVTKDIMSKCAQLGSYDEELYKITDEGGDDKYLIATAEQPLCAYHKDDLIGPKELPIRYAGYSSCFRKEAGSHGRDTGGLFRVHQFEKVEQFCITSPNDSWNLLEEMVNNSQEFYETLKLPYQVVEIVSGALNDAAARKYDLEAWFPASATYRELVSCSNCTDYQSRKLNIRFQHEKSKEKTTQYCHLLNSTLTATERTLCCILENYQTKEGVNIPEVLQPYMGSKTFLPFLLKKTKEKKPNA